MKTAQPPFRVLFDHDQILRRAHELARQIRSDHVDEPPMLVAVIDGARPFARLLQQTIPGAVSVHEVRASSYAGTQSTGQVTISVGRELPVRGRSVLLIEDIVDTGRTIAALRQHFVAKGAKQVGVVSMLSKPSRRVVEVPIEYLGFEIPDEFVIGFGMDIDGRYRDLPDIVVYDVAVEQAFVAAAATGH